MGRRGTLIASITGGVLPLISSELRNITSLQRIKIMQMGRAITVFVFVTAYNFGGRGNTKRPKVAAGLKKWGWLSAGYRRFIGMIGAKKFQVSEKCQKKISMVLVRAEKESVRPYKDGKS
jgi:hypothetical protein